MSKFLVLLLLLVNISSWQQSCHEQKKQPVKADSTLSAIEVPAKVEMVTPAAYRLQEYLPLLKGKRLALVVNQTSLINTTHLIDTLHSLHLDIKKILAPEHGFRGDADAGETVKNSIDTKTGIPVVSLYGNNKKPTKEQLQDIDVVVFDIQDVGARFYTYISTLHYVMQACADYGKKLVILDRPNPNGYYVAGPVLEPAHRSFIGMHPIPIVHGLTEGELAQMINGEKWLDSNRVCNVSIIKCAGYTHKSHYSCPVRPSPNLPNDLAIQLYPSLCLFEGTVVSVGRGTLFPFQVMGAPSRVYGTFKFTPADKVNHAVHPMHENKECFGRDLRTLDTIPIFTLSFLIEMYNKSDAKDKFFNSNNFFSKLAGNTQLQQQIVQGLSEEEIVKSWQPALQQYKTMRKKYLLYEDYE